MSFATRMQHTDATAFTRMGTPALLGGVPVTGIFDNGFALAGVGAYGMASSQPAITLTTASVPYNPVGLPLDIVDGARYKIAAHEPDGTGVSRLLLEVVS